MTLISAHLDIWRVKFYQITSQENKVHVNNEISVQKQ